MTSLAKILLPAAALGLLMLGCSADESDSASTPNAPAAEVATITPGTLTVCTFGVTPFEFQTDDGQWTGFDIDLLTAMTSELNGGLDLAVTVLPLDDIWLAPGEGTCDVVATALTITGERAEVALFTDPYFASAQSLMVLSSRAGELTDLATVSGQRIGVLADSSGAAYAQANAPQDATVVGFDTEDALFDALDDGSVDAVIHDLPLTITRSRAYPDRYALVGEYDTGERYGFAVAKDNTALADVLNQQLKVVRTDGSYREIYDRYFSPVGATTP